MSGIYWLASYPKSGNTWFRAFLRNLQEDGDAPVSINEFNTGGIASSRGWLDEVLGFDTADLTPGQVERLRPAVYRWSLRDTETGYHKVHDAWTLTDRGEPVLGAEATRGALYIIRNPLDVVSSAANHWHCSIDEAIGTMAKPDAALCKSKRRLTTQVRQRMLSWSAHALSWIDAPGIDCRVIRYEDMLAKPMETFQAAARMLHLPDDAERVAKAIRFSSFSELSRQEETSTFRERPHHTQRFFRKGRSGGWREELSPEQIEAVIRDHGEVMRRFGYLGPDGRPLESGA